MPGVGVEPLLVGDLDDLAEVHHRDPVGDVLHHAEIVGDEQIGQLELGLQVLHQVDDLGLDRDVERRDRLVADDELGMERQRAGDADALALAAGELVREALGVVAREADHLEQLAYPPRLLRPRPPAVDHERLGDDVLDRHARIERAERVLEDDLHLAPHRPHALGVQALDRLALEADGAAGRLDQADQHAPGGGLAAARLADEAERPAARDREIDAVDRAHRADLTRDQNPAGDREVLGEALGLDQGGARRGACSMRLRALADAGTR